MKPLALPIGTIQRLIAQLAQRVGRNELFEAVFETKLVTRSTRDEMRHRFREKPQWIKFVVDALLERSTHAQALRCIAMLVEAYVRTTSDIDHRIETCLRKARQAAERGDPDRIRREGGRLIEINQKVQHEELHDPLQLIYLYVNSENSRSCVAQLLPPASTPPVPDIPAPPSQHPAATRSARVEPSAVESHTIAATTIFNSSGQDCETIETLRTRLHQLTENTKRPTMRPSRASALENQIELPPAAITWPHHVQVSTTVHTASKLLRDAADAMEAAGDQFVTLPAISEAVNLAHEADAPLAFCRAELDRLFFESRETALRLLPWLGGDPRALQFADRLGAAGTFTEALTGFETLMRKAREDAANRRTCALEILTRIENACEDIPEHERAPILTDTERLVLALNIDQLESVAQRAARIATEVRHRQDNVNSAALHGIAAINTISAPELPIVVADNILQAARDGAQDRIDALLRPYRRQVSDSPAHPTDDIVAQAERLLTIAPPATSNIEVPRAPLSSILDEIVVSTTGFVARDRLVSANVKSADGRVLVRAILDAACFAMQNGPFLGTLDSALDLVALGNRASRGGRPLALTGLAFIALLPVHPTNIGSATLDDASVRAIIADPERAFTEAIRHASIRSGIGTILAERFSQDDVLPFVKDMAFELWRAAAGRRHVLEEVALGIGDGARYGTEEVAKCGLVQLASEAGLEDVTIRELQVFLQELARADAAALRHVDRRVLARLPDWLTQGIRAYESAVATRRPTVVLATGQRSASLLRVQAPPIVQGRGGFKYRSGSPHFDMALLISNPKGSGRLAFAVEVTVRALRSTPRPERDVVAYVGVLQPDSRVLAPLRLPFGDEGMHDDIDRMELQFELRWKEPGGRETRVLDGRVPLALNRSEGSAIDDYRGVEGKPLILEGEAFKLSSGSVKDSFNELQTRLQGRGGIAALVVGRRRRGKTSILTTISKDPRIKERYLIVEDTWEDLPFRSVNDALVHLGAIFDRVARELSIELPSLAETLSSVGAAGWTEIQHWLTDLASRVRSGVRVLLLIDEFQKWMSSISGEGRTRLLSILRGIYNRPAEDPVSTSIILFGLSNIKGYVAASADFKNAFRIFDIRPFNQEETDALVRSNTSIEFDTRAVTTIRSLSGGNPFLINLLGSLIAGWLRREGRNHCFPDDVERVVRIELEDENSRVRTFVEYLLKQGEEDHAPEIEEIPSLVALAWTLRGYASPRQSVPADAIGEELTRHGVECHKQTLEAGLAASVENELVVKDGQRYGFASRWLAEWLEVMHKEPLPVTPRREYELVLNRYKLGKCIGEGGQARVFEAIDTRCYGNRVVLKIYPRSSTEGTSSLGQREAQALTRIQHRAVVRCMEVGNDPERGDVLVLEPVSGRTLRTLLMLPDASPELVGMNGRIPVQLKLLEQIASALRECHGAGVVHKDLKPENIILEQSAGLWFPKIVDFGLSSGVDQAPGGASEGGFTPGYVAPERQRGERRGPPSDIYLLGMISYEILTGERPFPDPPDGYAAQLKGEFVPLKTRRPEIPQRLSEIIGSMLALDPAARPNAHTVASELPLSQDDPNWRDMFEQGKHAYGEADAATAFQHFERAAFSAGMSERNSTDYHTLLCYLVELAKDNGKVAELAARIIQPLVVATLQNDNRHDALSELVGYLLSSILPTDEEAKASRSSALQWLVEHLAQISAVRRATGTARLLLREICNPAMTRLQDDVFLVGSAYRFAGFLDHGEVVDACVSVSRALRERGSVLSECEVWLQRAERIGGRQNSGWRDERAEIDLQRRKTANPATLPKLASTQEPSDKTIGDGEQGHLRTDRIKRWVGRLLSLHGFVYAVRRVRKDPGISPYPTRVLDVSNLSQHLSEAKGLDAARIVPAVLNAGFTGTGVALRINIILSEGTTLAEREVAMDRLRDDKSLFGDES